MQEKSSRLQAIACFTGLEFNTKKTNIVRLNSNSQHQIFMNGAPLEDVDKFVCLGSEMGKPAEERRISAGDYPLPEVPL